MIVDHPMNRYLQKDRARLSMISITLEIRIAILASEGHTIRPFISNYTTSWLVNQTKHRIQYKGDSYCHHNMSDNHHPKYLYMRLDRSTQYSHSTDQTKDKFPLQDSSCLMLQSNLSYTEGILSLLNHPSKHTSGPLLLVIT